MKQLIRKLKPLKPFVPSTIYKMVQKMFADKVVWSGDYNTWEEAERDSDGYDSKEIFEKVSEAALMVERGKAIYERDSVIFDEIQYSYPLLACLMYIAARSAGEINILDFGGGLGTTYFQNQIFLNRLSSVKWNIVEQSHFVDFARKNFNNRQLKFYDSIDQCAQDSEANVILFSSVLQYLRNPYELLGEVIHSKRFEYILIDRTGFVLNREDRLTVQKVPPGTFCEQTYPCWFFNKYKFKSLFQRNYEKIIEFDAIGTANIPSQFKGMFFQRKN